MHKMCYIFLDQSHSHFHLFLFISFSIEIMKALLEDRQEDEVTLLEDRQEDEVDAEEVI